MTSTLLKTSGVYLNSTGFQNREKMGGKTETDRQAGRRAGRQTQERKRDRQTERGGGGGQTDKQKNCTG